MEAAVVGAVAGVGTGLIGGVGVGVGVGVVSGALTAVVKTYLTAVPPPAEEEPKKPKKKAFVKPEPKKEEESEEEQEEKLSAGQKRRLLEKKKKEEAKAKEEEAKKAAAAKKADKKKGKQAGKAEAKDNLAAAGAPAIKGAAAPAVKAAAAAPGKSNAPPPAKVSAAEPAAAEDGKKKKKKKKGSSAAKAADEPVAQSASSPSSGPAEAAGADEWEQQASQVKEEKRASKAAEKKKKADAAKAQEGQAIITDHELIDKEKFGPIIGKGGDTLRNLQERTGCKITLPRRDDSSERFIKLEGTQSQIAAVRKAFKQLLSTGISDVTHPNEVLNEIAIKEKASGQLVGKGGAVRIAIEELGVKMKVPDRDSGSNIVKLIGTDEAVREARLVIQAIMDEGFHPTTHPNWVKVQVVFPQSHLKHLFGPGGKDLTALQKATETRVNVPPKDQRETTGPYANTIVITIVGAKENVEKARHHMAQIAAIVEEDMTPILLDPAPEWAGPSADLSAQNEW